jgi:CRISPR-associated protein Csm3
MTHKFVGKYIIVSKLECVTGLHIGGSTTGLEIGGLDNPVIKDPVTEQPYIPGSSLKGKLRSLLEWQWGLIKSNDGKYNPYDCEDLLQKAEALWLARLFGPHSNTLSIREAAGPTRLTVRDSFLTKTALDDFKLKLGTNTYTEVKIENVLDRVTSTAMPRPMERVPRGAQFETCMILDVYEMQPDTPSKKLLEALFTSFSMLEHSSLGGGGSRGSGQVAFKDIQIVWRSAQDYASGNPGTPVNLPGQVVEEILKGFASIQWPA